MLFFAVIVVVIALAEWWYHHRKYAPLIRAREQRLREQDLEIAELQAEARRRGITL
jgi:hypothetical protein